MGGFSLCLKHLALEILRRTTTQPKVCSEVLSWSAVPRRSPFQMAHPPSLPYPLTWVLTTTAQALIRLLSLWCLPGQSVVLFLYFEALHSGAKLYRSSTTCFFPLKSMFLRFIHIAVCNCSSAQHGVLRYTCLKSHSFFCKCERHLHSFPAFDGENNAPANAPMLAACMGHAQPGVFENLSFAHSPCILIWSTYWTNDWVSSYFRSLWLVKVAFIWETEHRFISGLLIWTVIH